MYRPCNTHMHKWIQYPLPCGRQSWNQRQLGKQSQWVPGKDEWLITNTDRSLITTYNDRHQVVVEGLLPQYIAATKVVSKPKIGQYAYMHKVYTCTLEKYRGGKHINHTCTLEDYHINHTCTLEDYRGGKHINHTCTCTYIPTILVMSILPNSRRNATIPSFTAVLSTN